MFFKQLFRGTVAKTFSGEGIDFIGKHEDLLIGIVMDRTSFGDESPEQPVGSFIDRSFPGGIRMGKVDVYAKGFKGREGSKLISIIGRDAAEDLREPISYCAFNCSMAAATPAVVLLSIRIER